MKYPSFIVGIVFLWGIGLSGALGAQLVIGGEWSAADILRRSLGVTLLMVAVISAVCTLKKAWQA